MFFIWFTCRDVVLRNVGLDSVEETLGMATKRFIFRYLDIILREQVAGHSLICKIFKVILNDIGSHFYLLSNAALICLIHDESPAFHRLILAINFHFT